MATVITNLLSAIPVFGKDLVELIWAKDVLYYSLIIYVQFIFSYCHIGYLSIFYIIVILGFKINKLAFLKIGLTFIAKLSVFLKYFIDSSLKYKKFNTSLSILSIIYSKELPVIGKINWSKVRKEIPLTGEDVEYLKTISCDWLARLAGIIDGDGYISIVKSDNRGYVSISLKIGLIYKELPMLESFIDKLKIGRIDGPYKNVKGQDTIYLIFNRTELQQVLFPLFIYNNIYFLTEERRFQYKKALYYMESGEVKFKEDIDIFNTNYLNKEINNEDLSSPLKYQIRESIIPSLPETAQDYLNLPFFKAWLVGFTISEGSFFVKNNLDACFEIRQRSHPILFEAFNLLFKSTRKIGIEQGKYAKFSVSSKTNIQEVINFFSFSSNPPLIGTKLQQYLNWLEDLKASKRYKNLKFT